MYVVDEMVMRRRYYLDTGRIIQEGVCTYSCEVSCLMPQFVPSCHNRKHVVPHLSYFPFNYKFCIETYRYIS